MAKKPEMFFCPRCGRVTSDVVGVGGSTFCASCLAGIEPLIVANVPPVLARAAIANAAEFDRLAAAFDAAGTLVDEPQA